MKINLKFALALAITTGFSSTAHAQFAGGGGGLIAAGQGIAVPTIAGPPPLGVPLSQQVLAGVAGPASTGGAVGVGLGGLAAAAGPLALGLGAIIAVGAIAQGGGQGGGSTAGTN